MTSKAIFTCVSSTVIRAPTFFLPIYLSVCLYILTSNLYSTIVRYFSWISIFIRQSALIKFHSKAQNTKAKAGRALTVSLEILYWLTGLMNSVMWLMCWHFTVAPLWHRFPRAMTTLPLLFTITHPRWVKPSHSSSQSHHSTSAGSWPWYTLCRTSQITFILSSSGLHMSRGWWLTNSHLLPWHSYWLTSVDASHLTLLYSSNSSFVKHCENLFYQTLKFEHYGSINWCYSALNPIKTKHQQCWMLVHHSLFSDFPTLSVAPSSLVPTQDINL